jgi:hypothetical protein
MCVGCVGSHHKPDITAAIIVSTSGAEGTQDLTHQLHISMSGNITQPCHVLALLVSRGAKLETDIDMGNHSKQ